MRTCTLLEELEDLLEQTMTNTPHPPSYSDWKQGLANIRAWLAANPESPRAAEPRGCVHNDFMAGRRALVAEVTERKAANARIAELEAQHVADSDRLAEAVHHQDRALARAEEAESRFEDMREQVERLRAHEMNVIHTCIDAQHECDALKSSLGEARTLLVRVLTDDMTPDSGVELLADIGIWLAANPESPRAARAVGPAPDGSLLMPVQRAPNTNLEDKAKK